jgi:transposase-like protein
MNYTEGFKARQVRRMAGPEGMTASSLAKEIGVSQPTLSRWLRTASNVGAMTGKERKKNTTPDRKRWTPEEKLRMLGRASQLGDDELGAFLRTEGIHEATLRQWADAAIAALAGPAKPRSAKKSPEAKRVAELERDLRRKEKALAEMAALITLQKKVQAIWGDGGDDTDTKSGT